MVPIMKLYMKPFYVKWLLWGNSLEGFTEETTQLDRLDRRVKWEFGVSPNGRWTDGKTSDLLMWKQT